MDNYGHFAQRSVRPDKHIHIAIPILVPKAPPVDSGGGGNPPCSKKQVKFLEPISGRFDLRGISSSSFYPPKEDEKKRALWFIYLIYVVLFVLVVGFMVSVGAELKRPRPDPGLHQRAPRDNGLEFIDCVRIVSSPNSSTAEGAIDEVWRAGLRPRKFSVQRLKLNTDSHKKGCFDGHREAHRWAVAHNCKTTLVLEDDVVFVDNIENRWEPVATLINSGAEWDTLWLGYVGIRIDPAPEFPGIVHLQKPMLAHAILFSRATSERILALPPWKRLNLSILEAYDVSLWHSNATRLRYTFGVDPPLAAQLSSRIESYSLDKNADSDFFKTFWGMGVFNYWARKSCSSMYQLSPAISRIIGTFSKVSPDRMSLQHVYTCDGVEPLG